MLVLAVAVFTTQVLKANDSSLLFQPANFISNDPSRGPFIKFPKDRPSHDFAVPVYCRAKIGHAEEEYSLHCRVNREEESMYRAAVHLGSIRSAIEPAYMNGKPVTVWFYFSVVFMCRSQDCRIFTVPNWGSNSEDFGPSYIAPQEIVDDAEWRKAAINLPIDLNPKSEPDMKKRKKIASKIEKRAFKAMIEIIPSLKEGGFSVDVDVNGAASNFQPLGKKVSNKLKRQLKKIKTSVLDSGYIPGHVNNVPTGMRYVTPNMKEQIHEETKQIFAEAMLLRKDPSSIVPVKSL